MSDNASATTLRVDDRVKVIRLAKYSNANVLGEVGTVIGFDDHEWVRVRFDRAHHTMRSRNYWMLTSELEAVR